MKAFIWDLDGTLINSYDVIVESLHTSLKKLNINLTKKYINQKIIETSVSKFLLDLENELGMSLDFVRKDYLIIEEGILDKIKLMPNAKEILEYINLNGGINLIFTHRGDSLYTILKNNDILKYFYDIANPYMGLKRKPSGDGIKYLINKHKLDINDCYYIGDRILDMKSSKDANVKGILYIPRSSLTKSDGSEYLIINDLLELKELI